MSSRSRFQVAAFASAVASLGLVFTGCLGPQVDDTVVGGEFVLPAGVDVPVVGDGTALASRIAELDGVGELIPRISAFADGERIHYWDFGETVDFAAPIYMFYDPATGDMIPGMVMFDVVPGDPGYSPFWAIFRVPVTERYAGELIPSMEALEEAQNMGLIGAPEVTGKYINCPVVALDARMEMGAGGTMEPPKLAFYRGQQVGIYDFAELLEQSWPDLEEDGISVAQADLYHLRREGGEPLSEAIRRVDMTGDGDIVDSNDILAVNLDPPTPVRREVSVVVPQSYISIDDTGDETMADFRAASDLFDEPFGQDRGPVVGNVVAYDVTGSLHNIVVDTRGTP